MKWSTGTLQCTFKSSKVLEQINILISFFLDSSENCPQYAYKLNEEYAALKIGSLVNVVLSVAHQSGNDLFSMFGITRVIYNLPARRVMDQS